ncbi:hypothetical protein CK203_077471 [Vitis vinifera]|uniref:Chromo domain-containing protein n=1 Tax=Vitis vinifera TaxID=29760 RepID=A0A438DT49_VITVI|nr:hypothetical protein CK203_077471 [Vitis vinifera]
MKKWADKKRRHTEYKVGDMVGKVSYKVELPPRLKIHLVFHEVEHIIVDRIIRRRGVPPTTEYLVKWKGLPESEASWEPANALWQFQEQIERSGQKMRRGRLRLRWGRVSQDASNDPPMAYIGGEKLLETLGDIHT